LEFARFQDAIASGWAVNGVQPTLRALARGQVHTLFVQADAEAGPASPVGSSLARLRIRQPASNPQALATMQNLQIDPITNSCSAVK
jgi:peptide subunit release factor 1 (eRF1)